MTTPTASKQVTYYSDLQLTVGGLSQNSGTAKKTETITWDASNYSVQSATLDFNASSGYLEGAEVDATFNANDLGKVCSWGALDTSRKTPSIDVSSIVANGANELDVKYHIAIESFPFTSTTCVLSATLTVILAYTGTGTPKSPWGTTIPTWEIVAGVAAAAVAVTVIIVKVM